MEYKTNYEVKNEERLDKHTRSDETWNRNLESLKYQIRDMCDNDPVNKIGNFI